jgi:Mg2+-importing ATPase
LTPSIVLPKNILAAIKRNSSIQVSPSLVRAASVPAVEVLSELKSGAEGPTEDEAQRRLEEHGPNVVAQEHRFTRLRLFIKACLNPLVFLLSVLAIVSFATAENTSDLTPGS